MARKAVAQDKATLAVFIGIDTVLRDVLADDFDHTITAPRPPYYGAREGMSDDVWDAHKAPIREEAVSDAKELIGLALRSAKDHDVTVFIDTLCYGISGPKGWASWPTIAVPTAWAGAVAMLKRAGATIENC